MPAAAFTFSGPTAQTSSSLAVSAVKQGSSPLAVLVPFDWQTGGAYLAPRRRRGGPALTRELAVDTSPDGSTWTAGTSFVDVPAAVDAVVDGIRGQRANLPWPASGFVRLRVRPGVTPPSSVPVVS